MYCPNCGKEIPDGSKFCKECGVNIKESVTEKPRSVTAPAQELEKGKMLCPKCGKPIPNWSITCPICGFPVKAYSDAFNAEEPKGHFEKIEDSHLATIALIFSFIVPIVGLILAIIDIVQNKEGKNHAIAVAALIISIVMIMVAIIIYPQLFKMLSSRT